MDRNEYIKQAAEEFMDDIIKSRALKDKAQFALDTFMRARETAKETLIDIVKAKGGYISLIPTGDKPQVSILVHDDALGWGDSVSPENIYGIRYEEGEGLMILTETTLGNYEYDFDYDFHFIEGFSAEDLERLNDIVKEPTYYVSFEEISVQSNSVISILGSIQNYI